MVAKPRAIRDIESIVMGSGDAENPRAVELRLEVFHPALLIPLDTRDSGAKSSITTTRDNHGWDPQQRHFWTYVLFIPNR